mgnify:CR=1 FL=1
MLTTRIPVLLAGPYIPPDGAVLYDEIDGDVEVGGWSNGPISWPRRKKTGRHSLILCGDLVRAVRTESAEAIIWWFGVSAVTVAKWRSALGVDRKNNPGTLRLNKLYAPQKLTPERAAKGREAAAHPDIIAKRAASKRGKPAHPNTKAALLEAARRPKPEEWGKRANRWMREKKQ